MSGFQPSNYWLAYIPKASPWAELCQPFQAWNTRKRKQMSVQSVVKPCPSFNFFPLRLCAFARNTVCEKNVNYSFSHSHFFNRYICTEIKTMKNETLLLLYISSTKDSANKPWKCNPPLRKCFEMRISCFSAHKQASMCHEKRRLQLGCENNVIEKKSVFWIGSFCSIIDKH